MDKPKRIFKPDWKPESGEDRGLQAKHGAHDMSIGGANVGIDKESTEFKERFKRMVIPEK